MAMAAYLHNRLPSTSISATPYELWHKRKPSIGHIRIFGMPAYAHQNREQVRHAKLSDRSKKYVFVGFTKGIKAYKLYDPVTRQITYSRSVIFDESLSSNLSTPPLQDMTAPAPQMPEDASDTEELTGAHTQALVTHQLEAQAKAPAHAQ